MTRLDILKSYLSENIWNASYTSIKIEDPTSEDVNVKYGDNAIGFRKIIACWRSNENMMPNSILDENSGSTMEINEKTSYFAMNTIYHIPSGLTSDDNLNDSLVFFKNPHYGEYDWSTARLVDSSEGYISFETGIIDPDVVCILGGSFFKQFSHADEPRNFTPYSIPNGVVYISDDDYDLCLQSIGYPFITQDELEYSREQILNLAIKPAMEEYFKWFPKVEITTHPMAAGSVQEVPFPKDAYDIVHFDVQQGGASIGSGAIMNTLWRSFEDGFYGNMSIGTVTGSFFGNKAPKTNTNSVGTYLNSRAAMQGITNYNTRTDFRKFTKKDEHGNVTNWVAFYSTKSGVGEVHWAIRTYNFDDVEFAQRQNLIDYCSANVKLLFANLRKQVKTDIPGTYDYSTWITEANDTKKSIKEEWKSIIKSSGAILRGSL